MKSKDIFQRLHLIRGYHWWITYQFSNPANYPSPYWDKSTLPPLPSEDEEFEEQIPASSSSESVTEESSDEPTSGSSESDQLSDSDHVHTSTEEEQSSSESSDVESS